MTTSSLNCGWSSAFAGNESEPRSIDKHMQANGMARKTESAFPIENLPLAILIRQRSDPGLERRRTATGRAARPSNLASPARYAASACFQGLRPRAIFFCTSRQEDRIFRDLPAVFDGLRKAGLPEE